MSCSRVHACSVGLRSMSRYVSSSLFFFQAEDGIRDATVTGVQTCALPISHAVIDARRNDGSNQYGDLAPVPVLCESVSYPRRSEERRVGKECRSRWWSVH